MRTWLPHYPGEGPRAAYARNSVETDRVVDEDGVRMMRLTVTLGMAKWIRYFPIEERTDEHFMRCWDAAATELISTAIKGVRTWRIPENARPLSAHSAEVMW